MALRGAWSMVAVVVVGCSAGRVETRAQPAQQTDACGRTSPGPCGVEGKRLLKTEPARALAMLEAACRRGDVISCDDSGVTFAAQPKLAAELTTWGCETLRSQWSCRNLGVAYEKGNGVERDLKRALELYAKGCAAGEAKSCRFEGLLLNDKDRELFAPSEALKRFGKACGGRDAIGCSLLIEAADAQGAALQPGERHQLLRLACADGNGWGCLQLGQHEQSINIDATASFQQGCDWHHAKACDEAARLLWRDGKKDAAVKAALTSCTIDEKGGCWRMGLIAATETKYGFATQTWEAACAQGDGQSCRSAGLMYLHGKGVALDGEKAQKFFSRSCELSNAWGCQTQGWQLLEGMLITKDRAAALKALERGCELGSCWELGRGFEFGTFGPKDLPKARATFEKGCQGGELESCNHAGYMAYEKLGGPKDAGKAATAFSRACQGGHQLACSNLAEALMKGDGVLQDKDRAIALWATASKTQPYAFLAMGQWKELGWGGSPRDREAAFRSYEKACEQGLEEGCANAARLAKSLRVAAPKPPPRPATEAPPAPKGSATTQLALPDFGKLLSGF